MGAVAITEIASEASPAIIRVSRMFYSLNC
jgi:hypothetical protein